MESEFVFSLRSPYAWIAARVLLPRLPAGHTVRWTPFYPLPEFRNFQPDLEAKTRYIVRDVLRMTRHYGLSVEFPRYGDPDWSIPHAAFLAAEARGCGPALALALFAARWERGENPAEDAVMERAAGAVGLDPAPILAEAHDPERRDALTARIRRDYEERDVFGVPTLILPRGTRYWGHDRIAWALAEGRLEPDWSAERAAPGAEAR